MKTILTILIVAVAVITLSSSPVGPKPQPAAQASPAPAVVDNSAELAAIRADFTAALEDFAAKNDALSSEIANLKSELAAASARSTAPAPTSLPDAGVRTSSAAFVAIARPLARSQTCAGGACQLPAQSAVLKQPLYRRVVGRAVHGLHEANLRNQPAAQQQPTPWLKQYASEPRRLFNGPVVHWLRRR